MHKQKVLFVCVENSNRSQMAQAFARNQEGKLITGATRVPLTLRR